MKTFGSHRERLRDAPPSAGARRTIEAAAVDRQADVVPIAHQQQLGDVLHRKRQTDDAVAPVVAGKRQRTPSR